MSAYTLPCAIPATSSVTKRFQFIRDGARPLGRAPILVDYATVWYLPFTTLKMWNFAPATSPLAVSFSEPPRMVEGSDALRTSLRNSARLIVPSLHAVVTALAYI